MRVAGSRRPAQEQIHVTATLTELVDQAVDNERWRLRRAVLAAISNVGTAKPYDHYSPSRYGEERRASDVKADIKRAVERAMEVKT